jgi:hypothetical protein
MSARPSLRIAHSCIIRVVVFVFRHVMITSPSLNVQKRVFSDEPPRSRGSGFFWTDLMPWLEEYITRLETGMYQL